MSDEPTALDAAEELLTQVAGALKQGVEEIDADALPAPVARAIRAASDYALAGLGYIVMLERDEVQIEGLHENTSPAGQAIWVTAGEFSESRITTSGTTRYVLGLPVEDGRRMVGFSPSGVLSLVAASGRMFAMLAEDAEDAETTNGEGGTDADAD